MGKSATRSRAGREQVVDDSLLVRGDIRKRVECFAGGQLGEGVRYPRSQSYDHCFNYFADTADATDDMEKSCAVLGFYLASWGMYRGSSYLLKETNAAHLAPVVEYIAGSRSALRHIDVDRYTDDNITATLNAYRHIRKAIFGDGRQRHITLVTKIMVAVFGCVPAFDSSFLRGFRTILKGGESVSPDTLNERSLARVADFYQANQLDIDTLHDESRTVAFKGSTVTAHKLTKAKIVDMYCFQLGRS